MGKKVSLFELDLDTSKVIKKLADLDIETKKLKNANKELADTTDKTASQMRKDSVAIAKNEVQIKNNADAKRRLTNVAKSLIDENGKHVTSENKINLSLNENVKSIQGARENTKQLTKLRNELNLKTEEGRKKLDLMNKKINENDAFIKNNSSSLEKNKQNVGNYQQSITGALGKVNLFGVNLGTASQQLIKTTGRIAGTTTGMKGMGVATAGTTKAVGGLNKFLRIFRIVLISTGLGAIIVLLGTLIAAFLSTQKGIDKLNEVLAPLKGAFQGIIGVVQNLAVNVFGQLKDRFIIIKNNILAGVLKMRIAWNKFTGDTKEAEILSKELAKNVEETEKAQGRVNKKSEEFGKILDGANDKVKESIKAQKEIEALKIKIEKTENAFIVKKAELLNQLKAEEIIAKDVLKTDAERLKAGARAEKLSKQLVDGEKNIVNLRIKQLKLKQSQNDTSREENKELKELEAKLFQFETTNNENRLKFQRAINGIKKKARDRDIKFAKERKEAEEKASEIRAKIFESQIKDEEKLELLALDKKIKQGTKEINALKIKAKEKLELVKLFTENEEKNRLAIIDKYKKIRKDKEDAEILENEKRLKVYNERIEQYKNAEFLRSIENDEKRAIEKFNIETESGIQKIIERAELEKLTKQQIDAEKDLYENERNLKKQELQDKFNIDRLSKEKALAQKEIALRNEIFDNAVRLFGEQTKLGKAVLAVKTLLAFRENLLRTRQLQKEKQLAIASATLDSKKGVAKTASSGFPHNVPFLIAYALQIAGLISALKNVVISKAEKFAQGGLLKGKSHAEGGIPIRVGNKRTIEAEGGEYIVNRIATEKNIDLLNLINYRGVVPPYSPQKYFATGGVISNSTNQNLNIDLLAKKIGEQFNIAVAKLPTPVVNVEDINTINTENDNIENITLID